MPAPLPRLAVSLGDCAGVGPELILRALASDEVASAGRLFVYGSVPLLRRVSANSGIPLSATATLYTSAAAASAASDGHALIDLPLPEAETLRPGSVQAACGRHAYACVRAAVRDIQHGYADALVTAPASKEALHLAGHAYPGHTELLAELTGVPDPCMAFHAPGFWVSLATIHTPLSEVPRQLTQDGLLRVLRLTDEACRAFGTAAPRLGVLALNPHAGENGLFGDEETRVILPALARARAAGINAAGPLVPDTAFAWLGSRATPAAPFDAFVAMYHDQGLIPFKLAAFDTGVNVTLGLPLVRTSPDHGTAFDLAWQGRASPQSLFHAIALAARMSRLRHG